MGSDDEFYFLNQKDTDPKRLKAERDKARELRKTPWWKEKLRAGLCHYCQKVFRPAELTMDHLVPLARGGRSVKNNLVPACKSCNSGKKLATPVDLLLREIEAGKKDSPGEE
jgi:5-methylcytosine-specific restriction protein A